MKKKLLPAISFGIAVLLIGGIAYATDRRKNSKNVGGYIDDVHEEELQSELLNIRDSKQNKPVVSDDNIIAAIVSDDNKAAEPAKEVK